MCNICYNKIEWYMYKEYICNIITATVILLINKNIYAKKTNSLLVLSWLSCISFVYSILIQYLHKKSDLWVQCIEYIAFYMFPALNFYWKIDGTETIPNTINTRIKLGLQKSGTVVFAFLNLGCSFVYPTWVNVSKQCNWTKNQ